MTQRRDFIIGAGSMLGIAAVSPTLIAAPNELAVTAAEMSHPYQPRRWLALYDDAGHYVTDIKLIRTEDERHSTDVEQFSLIWRSRYGVKLTAGTYIVEDFETEPKAIYLEPSNVPKRNNLYRASFSLLKQAG